MVSRSERVYQRLLGVLPPAFREEAEPELLETFRASQARVPARLGARLLFWWRMAADLVVTSTAERRAMRRLAHQPRPPLFSQRNLMHTMYDVRIALRSLLKQRGFAATAVLTLALGVGATVAIFSVVNGVLIEPLPYRDPARLVLVWQELRARGVREFPFPPGDIPDLREKGTMLESVATIQTFRQSLSTNASDPEQVKVAFVTPNLFRVLGLGVVRGRDFEEADGTPPPPPPVQPAPAAAPGAAGAAAAPPAPVPPPPPFAAILSHEFWQRHFGGDASVVGRSLQFGGATAFVVGIAEPEAQLLFPPRTNVERSPDLWVAGRTNFATGTRTAGVVRVVARMKPGVSVAQLQTQMDALATELRAAHPVKRNAGVHITAVSMHETLVSDVRVSILALMGAVTFVLLIACANLANLTMTQSARRERDLAVRAALGAGRATLVRQMLIESGVLAAAGAIGGLALARTGILVLQEIGPANLPRLQEVAIDTRVLAFTAVAAIGSVILFGLLPAFRASRPDVTDVLRRTGRVAGLGHGRLRGGLVVVEVALTFVLLIGSGLMVRSMIALQHVDPGYDPNGVLTFLVPNFNGATPQARAAFMQRMRTEIGALPGVTAVSGASPLPLDGGTANMPYGTEAAAADPTQFAQAAVHTVQPGYFEAMRARVLEGRVFTERDNTPDAQTVVVDRLLAARTFPGQSAVGKRLLMRIAGQNPVPFEIIGVVAHERHATLTSDGREAVFFLDGQRGFGAANRWIVRTDQDPARLADTVKAAVARIDRTIALADVQPMSALVEKAQAPTWFALVLTSVFAAIAAILAAVGLYGVLSTIVSHRTAEIGVRLAFGAERRAIFRLIVGRGLVLSAIGIVIGAAAAFGVTRTIQSLLVDVRATDPATFAAIVVLFVAVATAACGIPAYRASRLDPTIALRRE
jgi:putative ABC transport system permease protein